MVKSGTVRLTYRGGVRGISMLAQMLEEQGVSVWYTPPRETRDMTGPPRFRQQFGARAQIVGLPEPKQSVEERLAALDQLLADGKITPEEHTQQRTRILNELSRAAQPSPERRFRSQSD